MTSIIKGIVGCIFVIAATVLFGLIGFIVSLIICWIFTLTGVYCEPVPVAGTNIEGVNDSNKDRHDEKIKEMKEIKEELKNLKNGNRTKKHIEEKKLCPVQR